MKISGLVVAAIVSGFLFGGISVARAQDKCNAVYKKYPIQAQCGKDQSCFQKNMENRNARKAAGCKATKNYKY